MKQVFLIFAFVGTIGFGIAPFLLEAKQPAVKTEKPVPTLPADPDMQADTAAADAIPDTLTFTADGKTVTIITTDAKDVASAVQDFYKENQGQAKNWKDWLFAVVAFLLSVRGANFITNARKVGGQLVSFVGKSNSPVNTLVFVSAAAAAGITFLWQKQWDTPFFFAAMGWVFMGAVVVYEKILKNKKAAG